MISLILYNIIAIHYLLLLKVITEEVYKMLETETHLKKMIIPVRPTPLHPGHPTPATYSYILYRKSRREKSQPLSSL